jgi:hypothetical protein
LSPGWRELKAVQPERIFVADRQSVFFRNLGSQSRYLLPKDLAGALQRLDDTEVDTLLAAVTSEAKRRGRLPRGSASKTSASSTKRAPAFDLAHDPWRLMRNIRSAISQGNTALQAVRFLQSFIVFSSLLRHRLHL